MNLQTVWSIDVGKSSLKAVKVHRERNHLEIVAVDKINYTVDSGGIDAVHQAKEAIATFGSRHVINCPVVVSHPGHSAFSRFIQLPPVDEKKLAEMIGYEAQQQIPFPIDEVRWGYHVCGSEDGALEKEVGIFAVRSELLNDFILDYESSGIPVSMISIGYLGLLNYVLYDVRPSKPAVILDIGSEHTDLLVVDGKRFWIRNLAIAGNDVTQALMDKFKLSFADAERLKSSASKSDQAVKIFGVVQPTLKDLVNEIHRSVGFYKSQAGDVKFEDVYVFGNAARLVGLQKYLQEHLRFQVHLEKGFHRLRVNREANVALLQQDFASFAPSVGHAIQALGEGECQVNLLPQEKQEALEFQSQQKRVLLAACIPLVLIFILMYLYQGRTSVAEEALEETGSITGLKKNETTIKDSAGKIEANRAEAEKLLWQVRQRLEPHDGLRLLTAVIDADVNMQSVTEGPVSGEPTYDDMDEADIAQGALNDSKIWITKVDVKRLRFDVEGNETKKPPTPKRGDTTPIPPTDFGYRFQVHVMINAKNSKEEERNAIDARLRTPLEEKVRKRMGEPPGGANRDWVKLNPETRDNQGFIFSRGRLPNRQGDPDQTQGTFSEFQLEWVQIAGGLPMPDVEEENP